MTGRILAAVLGSVLAVGCSADAPAVQELRPAAAVNAPPPEPANFQSQLLPGAPRVAEAAPNPARGGQYPIGRARNPVPPGSRVAPVTPRPALVPIGLPAAPPTTADTLAPTTTTTTTSPPEAPMTTTTAPAAGASGPSAAAQPTTTTTTTPLLESEGIDP